MSVKETTDALLRKADLVLLDGKNILFRYVAGAGPFAGVGTRSVADGATAFLNRLGKLATLTDGLIVVAWDPSHEEAVGRPSLRREAFPAYKLHPPSPSRKMLVDRVTQQSAIVRDVLRHLNVPQYTAPGWEADDVLATLAQAASKRGLETLMFTSDSDLYQLVSLPRFHVVSPSRPARNEEAVTAEDVIEWYKVRPEQLGAFKALAGDNSDTVPGLPGIGPVAARRLLGEYGSIGEIVCAATVTGKWRLELDRPMKVVLANITELHRFEALTKLYDVPVTCLSGIEMTTAQQDDARVRFGSLVMGHRLVLPFDTAAGLKQLIYRR